MLHEKQHNIGVAFFCKEQWKLGYKNFAEVIETNHLMGTGNYCAISNNTKLVH